MSTLLMMAVSGIRRPLRVEMTNACLLLLIGLWLVSTAVAEDMPPIQFVQEWGQEGEGPDEFWFPIDIAINSVDELFITDHHNHRIQKFDTSGKRLETFATLSNPGGIAIGQNGELFLTHFQASGQSDSSDGDFVSVYSSDGRLLRRWGKKGKATGEFDCPGGIAVSADGEIFVADQTNRRVQVFSTTGEFLRAWGEYGDDPGQFGGKASRLSRVGGPQFVAFDEQGNVWATEGANCRVQSFTPVGKLLSHWGSDQDRAGGFGGYFTGFDGKPAKGLKGPVALCFDRDGHVWVSTVSGRIQEFDASGRFLRGLGDKQGTGPGEFFAPHGLAFDSAGHLFVVDSYNHRIQKFNVGK